MNNWISVGETLPVEEHQVLAFFEGGGWSHYAIVEYDPDPPEDSPSNWMLCERVDISGISSYADCAPLFWMVIPPIPDE